MRRPQTKKINLWNNRERPDWLQVAESPAWTPTTENPREHRQDGTTKRTMSSGHSVPKPNKRPRPYPPRPVAQTNLELAL